MLPFEFLIDGTPVSLQTRNRKRLALWRSKVEQEVSAAWPGGLGPLSEEVTVSITYFYDSEAPDVDNVIKPIQDAMKGVVYVDDSQVAHTESRKSRIDGSFRIKGVSEGLAIRLARGRDFVRVVVRSAPRHEDLQ